MLSRLVILGSTGSIGTSTLNVVRRYPDRYTVAGLAAGNNIDLFIEQLREFSPPAAYIVSPASKDRITALFPGIRVFCSTNGLESFIAACDYEVLVNALVGAVGLRPTAAALKANKKVALANKESLVIGGDFLYSILASGSGSLLPIDSEHSAILQCLSGAKNSTIESIILTASGGPFRDLPGEKFSSITVEQALNHPTWSMGKKITIDSATLMNKGFELIEAHHLFKVPYDVLRVWIHPQSIIHSLVEFHDGSVLAQLGLPDMELPIQFALSYPDRLPMNGRRLSLPEIGKLDFSEPDFDRFPCLKLCLDAGRAGNTAPAVVNAANEVAVSAFLEKKIKFTAIPEIVNNVLDRHVVTPALSLSAIEEADGWARRVAVERVDKI